MNPQIKSQIQEFLKNYNLAVISTIDSKNNRPESALVGYAETEALQIIFGTSNTTRKYKNLQSNQNVSFVFGWASEGGTLQYEGVARELGEGEVLAASEVLAKKNPRTAKFKAKPDQRYFIVEPRWARLFDTKENPGKAFEVEL